MATSHISVPRDLTKVKSKVMFNLTKRQLICFGVAALIGVPSFFLAMYEKNGQHLEVLLRHLIEATFIRPKYRPFPFLFRLQIKLLNRR